MDYLIKFENIQSSFVNWIRHVDRHSPLRFAADEKFRWASTRNSIGLAFESPAFCLIAHCGHCITFNSTNWGRHTRRPRKANNVTEHYQWLPKKKREKGLIMLTFHYLRNQTIIVMDARAWLRVAYLWRKFRSRFVNLKIIRGIFNGSIC